MIDDKKYKVVENLGYVHGRGTYAKVVDTENGEEIALKCGGKWKFAQPVFLPKSNYTGQGKM